SHPIIRISASFDPSAVRSGHRTVYAGRREADVVMTSFCTLPRELSPRRLGSSHREAAHIRIRSGPSVAKSISRRRDEKLREPDHMDSSRVEVYVAPARNCHSRIGSLGARAGANRPEPEIGFTSLFSKDNLEGWKPERLQPNAAALGGGILRLAAGPGW